MHEPFFHQFSLVVAHTPEQLRELHRLRFQVYCRELGFEREEDCPDGLECDPYDAHAVHLLVVHQATRAAAGCVRLVLSGDGRAEAAFPFEQIYTPDPALPALRLDPARRLVAGEISRLAVLPPFRYSAGADGQDQPVGIVSLVLALAAACTAVDLGIHEGYTVMEPRLARLLQRFGVEFRQVGALVSYRGKRATFVITPPDVRPLYDRRHPVFGLCDTIRWRIRQQLRAAAPPVISARAAEGSLPPSATFPNPRAGFQEAA